MKASIFLAALIPIALASDIFDRNVCNRDNCAREIIGTRKGAAQVSSHKKDCSSYQKVTDYVLKTVTTTSGSTSKTIAPSVTKAGLVTPTKIPKYAEKVCTGTRYESACLNCADVKRATTTITETFTVVVPTKVIKAARAVSTHSSSKHHSSHSSHKHHSHTSHKHSTHTSHKHTSSHTSSKPTSSHTSSKPTSSHTSSKPTSSHTSSKHSSHTSHKHSTHTSHKHSAHTSHKHTAHPTISKA